MLDKAIGSKKLSTSQKKRNTKKSKVGNQVEHPFVYIKEKLGFKKAVAKNRARNALRFVLTVCFILFLEQIICSQKHKKGERATNWY